MAVTVKDPGCPAIKVVLEALVIARTWVGTPTVSVKVCLASGVRPLLAVMVGV